MSNEELVIRIKAGIDISDNMLKLYNQVKSFIHTIAWKYRAYGEVEDLEQEGYLALYDAINGYDPDTGYKFLTYAENWIKQKMKRYIDNNMSCCRILVHSRGKLLQYKRLVDAFQKDLNRKPTDEEISYYLGLSLEQCQQLQKDQRMADMDSLDSFVKGMDGELTVGDTVTSGEDLESLVLDKIQQEQLQQELWTLVDTLEDRQPDVIRKRYQDNMTLDAIGQVYGVNREAIRQTEAKALRNLKKPKNSRQLCQSTIEEMTVTVSSGELVSVTIRGRVQTNGGTLDRYTTTITDIR